MLAIASLAAGVVTALVSPAPHADAAEHGPGDAVTGLLQEDQILQGDQEIDSLLDDTVQAGDGVAQAPEAGGLL
ncbi:hypothetical protein VO63_24075 [Streptomyces showdoensis]|uniref:Secreted protein n=2 Tax=Streptomyces showdoensis TaxID=68268 RepID=A0A2P2GIH9_STREW|nr:hypothetical protein VO63_24075 [Streptomyces showdoensis]